MDREQLIAAIEQLDAQTLSKIDRRGLIVLSKEYRKSTRTTWERVTQGAFGFFLSLGIMVTFALQFVFMGAIGIPRLSPRVFPGLMVLLIFGEGYLYFKLLAKITPKARFDANGMCWCCTRCEYDLSGHDSVFGEALWVGPETCPECGQKYPAVGA